MSVFLHRKSTKSAKKVKDVIVLEFFIIIYLCKAHIVLSMAND
jgi:hypothetical protein